LRTYQARKLVFPSLCLKKCCNVYHYYEEALAACLQAPEKCGAGATQAAVGLCRLNQVYP
jgi:hypothetical protein